MTFSLYGNPTEQLRLIAFGAETRDGRRVIRIEIEAGSAYHVSFALDSLDRVQEGQKGRSE